MQRIINSLLRRTILDLAILSLVPGAQSLYAQMAHLKHGTTPAGWLWGGVPYASADHGAKEYRGAYEFQYDKMNLNRGDGMPKRKL